ncbi:hypothetical protein [Streptomyces sp. NPDC048659]|uniref:hypothetical protein n=1 Tax=Streptomyces sp. NPDC048659 TaxID=3155489 RepID=UPI00343215EE
MDTTLTTYDGPATIEGEAVQLLRLRVTETQDDGVVFPDEPVRLLRSWTAEAEFQAEPKLAWIWANLEGGVEIRLPDCDEPGRALMTGMDVLDGGGWTVYFTGTGAPPMS